MLRGLYGPYGPYGPYGIFLRCMNAVSYEKRYEYNLYLFFRSENCNVIKIKIENTFFKSKNEFYEEIIRLRFCSIDSHNLFKFSGINAYHLAFLLILYIFR